MPNLTPEKIAIIAAMFHLDPAEPIVTENAEQAMRYHGEPCISGGWADDGSGRYDASLLLIGYLGQELQTAEASNQDVADFRRDAYGR